jgi:hypothetical protein
MVTQILYHDTVAASPGAVYFYHDKYSASSGAIYFYHNIFIPYGTEWNDIGCEIRVVNGSFANTNCDIRVVSERTSIRDMRCDIRLAQRMFYDANCDIRVVGSYLRQYDANCDIRTIGRNLYDIGCDIRVKSENEELYDAYCDIRVLSRNIYDANCDIRVQEDKNKLYNIGCDIRVKRPSALGLNYFKVYLDSVEIEDVDIESLNYAWTKNDTPAAATFRVVRKSDNFNRTLDNLSQAITTNTPIAIEFNDKLRYYGYVMGLDVEQSGESVVVNCLDRKQKVNEQLYNISFGRKWEFPEQGQLEIVQGDYVTTGQAITKILDNLVAEGIILSYSGVPTGFVPEYQEDKGTPAGQLLTYLLELSGNYYWNITPSGAVEIYEGGNGKAVNLPSQKIGTQIHLYDVTNYNIRLNDISNLITTVEVNMGTESEDIRASWVRRCSASLSPAWDMAWNRVFDYGHLSMEEWEAGGFGLRAAIELYTSIPQDERERKIAEVGRKFRLSEWTEGSFIDNSHPAEVIGIDNWRIKGWNWGGEYLTLAAPLIKGKVDPLMFVALRYGWVVQYDFRIPKLIGTWYKKEDIGITTQPTTFDVVWVGIGGIGAKRVITLSQLGIKDSIGWSVYEDGILVSKSEPGFDDTEYATDRARLMLSQINDPVTEGTIDLTFDAFEYYNLNLGNKVNISQTTELDIYNGNNGFPLDVESISFKPGNYIVSLNTRHVRPYIATKNFR